MKKYELTEETVTVYGKTLYRIRAVRDFGSVKTGEFGGYIEKEENLSHFGNAWIYGDARVFGNAWVYGDARVSENAWVYGDARVPAMQEFTAMQESPKMRGFTAMQEFPAMQEFSTMRGFTAMQKFSIRGISLYKDRSGAGMDTLHFTGLRMIR